MAELAVVLGYFTPPLSVLKSYLQPNTSSVFSLLDVCCLSSLLTLGVEFMTSTAASQGGANKVFWIHYSLILWIKRSQQQQTTRGLHLMVLPPCKEKRVQGLYWKHTHHMHSSTTLLQFSRKTEHKTAAVYWESLPWFWISNVNQVFHSYLLLKETIIFGWTVYHPF